MKATREEPKQLPLYKALIERMVANGQLKYGETYGWSWFLEELGMRPEELETWHFRGEWLGFCDAVKELGFRATVAGMRGWGFKLLERDRMADSVNGDMHRMGRSALKSSRMLIRVDRDGMTEEDKRRLDHWQMRAAYIGAATLDICRVRKLERAFKTALAVGHRLVARLPEAIKPTNGE